MQDRGVPCFVEAAARNRPQLVGHVDGRFKMPLRPHADNDHSTIGIGESRNVLGKLELLGVDVEPVRRTLELEFEAFLSPDEIVERLPL